VRGEIVEVKWCFTLTGTLSATSGVPLPFRWKIMTKKTYLEGTVGQTDL
jgi:hypothetical protein